MKKEMKPRTLQEMHISQLEVSIRMEYIKAERHRLNAEELELELAESKEAGSH